MKKYLTLLFIILASTAFSQSIRNSILGIYSGTYDDYYDNHLPYDVGVKVIAYPGDTSLLLTIDTTMNIIDTLRIVLGYQLFPPPAHLADTSFSDFGGRACGDYISNRDSMVFTIYGLAGTPQETDPQSIYYLKLAMPTAIKEYKASYINVYPNPATHSINISNNLYTNYTIYNISGQCMQSGKFIGNNVDVSQLANGFYCIVLENQKQKIIKSFIKE